MPSLRSKTSRTTPAQIAATGNLDGPADVFLPVPEMLETITGALPLLAVPGSPEFERLGKAAKCPLPPFREVNALYQDAFGVLQGDPWAVRSFMDGLERLGTIAPAMGPMEGPVVKGVRLRRAEVIPTDGPAIPRSRTIPIFAAGAALAQAGFIDAGGFRNTIAFAVCGFEQLGKLHALALEAMVSDAGRLHFAAALDTRWPECGAPPLPPVDPGIPFPERRHCVPWHDFHGPCMDAVFEQVANDAPAYTITQVTPNPACPGDKITITGTNFGTTPGLVVFRRLGGGTLEVAPATWSDTQVTVVVPTSAAHGLWLKVQGSTIVACGVVIDRWGPGQVFETFDGSAPVIEALYAAGSPTGPWFVEPGNPLGIQWRVYGATHVRVEVLAAGGGVLAVADPAPSVGTFASLLAPASTTPTQLTVRVQADGPCPPFLLTRTITINVTKHPAVSIDGLEVTQAVQYYRSSQHLTDNADYGADNTLPLVRDKATMVRVYVRSFRDAAFDLGRQPGITGTLQVEQMNASTVVAMQVLSPTAPATVSALVNPVYKDTRADRNATLNFLIPAAQVTSRLRLTATLQLPPNTWPSPAPVSTVTVDPVPNRRLRIAFIPVGYNGPTAVGATTTMTVAAPTLNDLLATLGDTLAMYPVSATPDIRTLPAHTRAEVVAASMVPAGGCGPNVGDLMGDLAGLLAADGNRTDAVYVALYATGIPDLWGGCGGGNLSVSEMNFGKILAHELGHAIGRPHAPCGSVGTPDPNYPAYEPYDTPTGKMAVIGDFGMDVRDGRVRKPAPVLTTDQQEADFMSYCGGANNGEWQWTSPYGYLFAHAHLPGLATATQAGGGSGAMGSGAGEHALPLLWISGEIIGGDECRVRHVAGVELHGMPTGRSLPYWAEVLDAQCTRLAVAPLVGRAHSGCCGGGSGFNTDTGSGGELGNVPFAAYLPVHNEAQLLRILGKDKVVLWERKRPAMRPRVKVTSCQVSPKGHVRMVWQSNVAPGSIGDTWVQWQREGADDGWRVLRVRVTGSEVRIPLESLPSGRARLRVVVHDGFSSVAAVTGRVTVPERGPRVGIIHPVSGLVRGRPVYLLLWGYGVDGSGAPLPDEGLVWRVNGEEVGRGRTVPFVPGEKLARYRIELAARDGKRTGRAEVVVDT